MGELVGERVPGRRVVLDVLGDGGEFADDLEGLGGGRGGKVLNALMGADSLAGLGNEEVYGLIGESLGGIGVDGVGNLFT